MNEYGVCQVKTAGSSEISSKFYMMEGYNHLPRSRDAFKLSQTFSNFTVLLFL